MEINFGLGDMSIPLKSKRVQVEVSMLIFERADVKKIKTLKVETIKVRDMRKAEVAAAKLTWNFNLAGTGCRSLCMDSHKKPAGLSSQVARLLLVPRDSCI